MLELTAFDYTLCLSCQANPIFFAVMTTICEIETGLLSQLLVLERALERASQLFAVLALSTCLLAFEVTVELKRKLAAVLLRRYTSKKLVLKLL